jgi:hypothetical protein
MPLTPEECRARAFECNERSRQTRDCDFGVKLELKLPRFRGHPTVWVFGVHNGKEAPTLRAGIPPADD